ncbi:hypothetical protein Curi_c23380 [Gottschalkia acidurici 9a]|uniref:Copper amine oxidase-like N-terminal domain-containing protein n=1 Tax=Gottschalkia acidurici (strain ATCC 7906 / DSM 604 / BCRC 14475 / CIP 104303 / KCTC 5404 / NCIMB 10678 / 9a) TaxID=1128398 RepID=K0B381_GOTA9|nr:copper amine oxidase N-terminal domain-containing protein [Gottschalkia acidurici]AFS79340.1 hypothetical protein Curi_c23380 [Gottschalkia acidurici 9a]
MVPLKVVYEHLGATVSWNNDSSTIDVLLNGNRINFKVGSKDFVINGKTLGSNEKVLIKNDKAFVDIIAVKLTSNYYLDFSQDQTVANLYDQNISIVIDRVKVSLNTYNETPDVPYLSYNINDQGFNVTNISNVSILARDIFEALGASVKWNNIERSTTINLKDDVIKLMVDTNEIYLNGIKSDYPTYLSFGKTKIRLGFLIDELNYHARWVQADKTIYLDKK